MKSMWTAFLLVTMATISGCGWQSEEKLGMTPPSKPSETPAVTQTVSKETLVRLQEADKLDGKEDHVIGKCYVCGLGMDGSAKHSVKVGEYTAHLCSEGCQKEFSKSSESIIAQTEIPKSNK